MSATDLAIVLAAGVTIAAFVVLLTTLQSLLRTVRELRVMVERVEHEALPLVGELRSTVRRAGAEVDRVDDLLDTASAIQHTVDNASRLTYVALSNPLIKVIAFFRGLARGVGRAFGRGGRRRRRVEHRRLASGRDAAPAPKRRRRNARSARAGDNGTSAEQAA
jgi:hypothetical protein